MNNISRYKQTHKFNISFSLTLGNFVNECATASLLLECCGTEEQKEKMFMLLMRERVIVWATEYNKHKPKGWGRDAYLYRPDADTSRVAINPLPCGGANSVCVYDLIEAARWLLLKDRQKRHPKIKRLEESDRFDFRAVSFLVSEILCGSIAACSVANFLESARPIVDNEGFSDYPCSEAAFFRASY